MIFGSKISKKYTENEYINKHIRVQACVCVFFIWIICSVGLIKNGILYFHPPHLWYILILYANWSLITRSQTVNFVQYWSTERIYFQLQIAYTETWLVSKTQQQLCLQILLVIPRCGDRGSTEVKVLRYKTEDCWFDPRWCHLNFSLTQSFRLHYSPGVDSVSNKNEYQEHFLGVEAAGA